MIVYEPMLDLNKSMLGHDSGWLRVRELRELRGTSTSAKEGKVGLVSFETPPEML